MGTLSTTNPTLADVAARMTADGKINPQIVEMLNETNEVLDDMTVIEANGFTEHKTTVRSGLPAGTWRKLNYGVQPSKSTTAQVTDTCGMLVEVENGHAVTISVMTDTNRNAISTAERAMATKETITTINNFFDIN